MQTIQFVSIENLKQMKVMKVIDTVKNMTKKEFQHFMESELIEVRKRKM
jgi:secreted Zn-dependent insulinase-like peptidase